MNGKPIESINIEIKKLNLTDGDIIHVSIEEDVSLETADNIGKHLREFLDINGHPNVQALITPKGLASISTLSEEVMFKLGWVRTVNE